MKRRLLHPLSQSEDLPERSCGRISERDGKTRQMSEQVAGRDFFLFLLTWDQDLSVPTLFEQKEKETLAKPG